MGRLVETNLPAARQTDGGFRSPGRGSNLRTTHPFGFQRPDERRQVLTHEVEHRSEHGVFGVSLYEITIARVDPEFCGRQREDQPSPADIDRAELQNISEERPIRFRIFAV